MQPCEAVVDQLVLRTCLKQNDGLRFFIFIVDAILHFSKLALDFLGEFHDCLRVYLERIVLITKTHMCLHLLTFVLFILASGRDGKLSLNVFLDLFGDVILVFADEIDQFALLVAICVIRRRLQYFCIGFILKEEFAQIFKSR